MQNKKAAAHAASSSYPVQKSSSYPVQRNVQQEERDTPRVELNECIWFFIYNWVGSWHNFFYLQLSRRLRLLKHLILKHARIFIFIFIFLVITWELGNMMVEKRLSIVSCNYGLVIKEYNLIQFSSFFGSNFSSFLVAYFYLGSIDFKICQTFLKTLVM